MQDVEIVESVRKKRFLINAFLHSASRPSGGGSELALKHAVTGYFLQAVTFELLIKILFALDQKKEAPFTHNLLKLYRDLKSSTREFIENKYDEARERRRQQCAQIQDVDFHPLDTVLRNNEKTVKNFKYDAMGVDSNSSIDSIFYNEIFMYIDLRLGELHV